MTDTATERELQTRFEQLRAELAVTTCKRCKGCALYQNLSNNPCLVERMGESKPHQLNNTTSVK